MTINKNPESVSKYQKENFGHRFLEDILEYINEKCEITEVFSETDILGWITNNSKFIADNFDPDDIFDKNELEAWAESNGFVKAEV